MKTRRGLKSQILSDHINERLILSWAWTGHELFSRRHLFLVARCFARPRSIFQHWPAYPEMSRLKLQFIFPRSFPPIEPRGEMTGLRRVHLKNESSTMTQGALPSHKRHETHFNSTKIGSADEILYSGSAFYATDGHFLRGLQLTCSDHAVASFLVYNYRIASENSMILSLEWLL